MSPNKVPDGNDGAVFVIVTEKLVIGLQSGAPSHIFTSRKNSPTSSFNKGLKVNDGSLKLINFGFKESKG